MDPPDDVYARLSVVPCAYCNRKFIPSSLEKHEKICEKTFVNKRKVFDSQKQRVKKATSLKVSEPEGPRPRSNEASKKSLWREKHEEFINAIRAARGIVVAEKLGKPLPPRCPSKIPSDYIPCPHCGRHFSPKSADRHIQWCKEQKSRIACSPKIDIDARGRLEARTKYKAPALKKRRPDGSSSIASSSNMTRTYQSSKSHNQVLPSPGKDRTSESHNAALAGNLAKSRDFGSGRHVTSSPKNRMMQQNMNLRSSTSSLPPTNQRGRQGKGARPTNNLGQGKDNNYNPYAEAEVQFQELLESGASSPTRGPHHTNTGQVKPNCHSSSANRYGVRRPISNSSTNISVDTKNSLCSDQTWASHGNSPSMLRCSKPPAPPLLRRTTIQVRDMVGPSSPSNRASWHACASSDSDDELCKYSEMGSGDLRASYNFPPTDKLNNYNNNLPGRKQLKKNGNQYESKSSLDSLDSDYSSSIHQTSLNHQLNLPANRKNRHQLGRSDVRVSDYENISSANSSSGDSTLPPLTNRNKIHTACVNYHSGNNSDSWTASFCHECGTGYPVSNAKFCCECGTRRLCTK